MYIKPKNKKSQRASRGRKKESFGTNRQDHFLPWKGAAKSSHGQMIFFCVLPAKTAFNITGDSHYTPAFEINFLINTPMGRNAPNFLTKGARCPTRTRVGFWNAVTVVSWARLRRLTGNPPWSPFNRRRQRLLKILWLSSRAS